MQTEKRPSSQGATWGLAILFGVVGAAIQQNVGGFFIGAAIGGLIAQILHLRSRSDALDSQLHDLKQRLADFRAAAPEERAPPKPVATAAPSAAPTPSPAPVPKPAVAAAATVTSRIEQPLPARAPPPRTPSSTDRAIAGFIAWLKRGNPLARIGIVILFLGASFLLKYANDNSMIRVELYFIAAALVGFALLVVGWRLRERRANYAQVLQGGAIAILYLTVFSATRMYQLLPPALAFGLLAVVAVASAVLAVAQNSLALAVIGTTGGFLAPILVSTGSGNYVALFTYYALLNLGVFAVAWFKTWRVLNVLGFLFTFSITGLWRASSYKPDDLVTADAFLILFFLMYVAVSILNCVRQPPNLKGYVSGSLVFGLPVVAFTLHATMISRIEYGLAWSAFALGAFYLLLGWTLFIARRETFRLLVEAFAALGVIFASLAIPLAFDTHTTAAMWAVEGAGLLWLGVRQERKLPRLFGVLLQAGAGLGYLIEYDELRSTRPILNSAYLGATMLAVSGVFSGYWLFRNEPRRAQYEAGLAAGLTFWGIVWWVDGGANEISRHLAESELGSLLIYGSITAAILTLLGISRQWPLPRWIALFLPAVFGAYAFLHAQPLGHPFAQWGALGWLAIFVTHFALLRIAEPQQTYRSRMAARRSLLGGGAVVRVGAELAGCGAHDRSLGKPRLGLRSRVAPGVARSASAAPGVAGRATSHRLSHGWRRADRRRAVHLDRHDQSQQHWRSSVATVPAAAQSAGCLCRSRAGGARHVVERARASAARVAVAVRCPRTDRPRGGYRVPLAQRRADPHAASQLGRADYGLRHRPLAIRAVGAVYLLGCAGVRGDDRGREAKMALRVDGRYGPDGGCHSEAVRRGPVEHRHGRANRLVPYCRPAAGNHRIFRPPSSEARGCVMTRTVLTAACVLLTASSAFGASPTLDDYSQGIDIATPGGLPLVETAVPDAVYQVVTRADLGDVRVFNAEGLPVPHAFCSSRSTEEPLITDQSLPVFELREAPPVNTGGSRIEVQTAGGTQVNVLEAGSEQPLPAHGRIHIIDARDGDDPIRAINFDWESPDGASQVQVSIEASDDLDQWRVLVPASTLLLADSRRSALATRAHRSAAAIL